MRVTLRALPLSLLWLAGLLPVVLWGVHQVSPLAAARTHLAIWSLLHWLAWYGGALALVLALLYPPFPAGVRLLLHTALARLRADRGPLLRAIGELRNFETAARHLEAGRAALHVHEPRLALQHLQRAIELEPELVAAYHQLGLVMLQAGQSEHAEAAFAQVVQRAADHAFGDALLWWGRCRMLRRDFAAAAELLTRHQREHGGNRRSHYWLGVSRRAAGDHDGARAAFAVAAAPKGKGRLGAEEGWYRARARVALWLRPGPAAAAAGPGGQS